MICPFQNQNSAISITIHWFIENLTKIHGMESKIETITDEQRFPGPVSVFLQRRMPETAKPVGYGALIDAFDLKVPVPIKLVAIGARHRVIDTGTWKILTPRHDPHASLRGHIKHALN